MSIFLLYQSCRITDSEKTDLQQVVINETAINLSRNQEPLRSLQNGSVAVI